MMKGNEAESLTQKQKTVFNFIKTWYSRKGYPPTIREIASHIGVKSTNAVHNYLKILYRKGYLTREDMKSRTWRPAHTEEARPTVSIPVLGKIAAGSPVHVDENRLGTVQIDASFVEGAESAFALQVTGDSMIDAGIFDGDFVFINPSTEISSGDIVATLIGDEATVKYYYKDRSAIRLQPANKAMAPIYLKPGKNSQIDTTIVGKIIGVYRKLL